MPEFSPFPGIRYDPEVCHATLEELTAPPYDVIDDDLRSRLASSSPHAAVHVSLPVDSAPGAGDRYDVAAKLLGEWRAGGVLAADPPGFYVYRMGFTDETGRPRQTSGVLGVLALDTRGDGSVLPHERTVPKAKRDRLELLRATRADVEPIWALSLTEGLSGLLEVEGPPIARCTDADGVHHRLYAVEGAGRARAIGEAMAKSPVVIADGHHRYETALAYAEERRSAGADDQAGAPGLLAFATELADDQVCVGAIHRIISGVPAPALHEALTQAFDSTPLGPLDESGARELRSAMDARRCLGLLTPEGCSLLTPNTTALEHVAQAAAPSLRGIDATVFAAALGDQVRARGADVTPQHDPAQILSAVQGGTATAGVFLRPPTVAQIRAVAEAGERMPEKTSFFWPKPRTGLVFRSLDEV